jgi:hypothetical protein
MADSVMWKASSAGKSMSPQSALDVEVLRRSIAQHTGVPRVYLGGRSTRFELPPCVPAKGRFHGEPAGGFRWRKFTKYAAGEIGRGWFYEGVVALGQDQQIALTVYRRRRDGAGAVPLPEAVVVRGGDAQDGRARRR